MHPSNRSLATICLALFLCVVDAAGFAAVAGHGSESTGSVVAPTSPARPPPDRADEIVTLLEQAEDAMARDQYVHPARGSALGLYDRVLALDSANAEARRGLERIAQHYLDLASTAVQRRQLTRAQSMVDWARIVDANHPGLAAAEAQIRMLADARRWRLPLESSELRGRSAALAQSLTEFGTRARKANCLATIRSPSDASGRWIYQQMSRARGDTRIRADIEIGSPPMVELLCFPDDA